VNKLFGIRFSDSVALSAVIAGLALGCGSDPTRPPAGLHTTATGLQYIDFVLGTGATPVVGREVAVHYTARRMDGTKFDSSRDHGTPFRFVIGGGQVIPGFDEGVREMKVGGVRRLIIPARLAWGEGGVPGVVPAGASVIFDLELLEVDSATPGPSRGKTLGHNKPLHAASALGVRWRCGLLASRARA
jgi:peptidylprolyl isomerase